MILENLRNIIDFYIRQKTRFSRKNYVVEAENVENLFRGALFERECELAKKYDLSILRKNTTAYSYRENLYTLDILDKYFPLQNKESIKVLDIGSKNWFYAKGEYAFFKAHCENVSMTGVELDAHRLYSDFYSRYEAAGYNIKDLDGVRYLAENLLNIQEKFDCITWILPFVKKKSLVKWGLPLKYFMPQELFKHACSLLNEGGKMFIVNQGEEEYAIQQDLFESLNAEYKTELSDKVESVFLEYQNERYGSVIFRL